MGKLDHACQPNQAVKPATHATWSRMSPSLSSASFSFETEIELVSRWFSGAATTLLLLGLLYKVTFNRIPSTKAAANVAKAS